MNKPDQDQRNFSADLSTAEIRSSILTKTSDDYQIPSYESKYDKSKGYKSVKTEDSIDSRFNDPCYANSHLEDLNNSFKSFGYACYKYSMLVLTIISICEVLASFLHISDHLEIPVIPHFIYILLNIWQAYQFFIAFKAIHRKDLIQAERTVSLMTWYIIVFVIINFVFLFVLRYNEMEFTGLAEITQIKPDNLQGIIILVIIMMLILQTSLYALILYGAIKIRDTLKEMYELTSGDKYAQHS